MESVPQPKNILAKWAQKQDPCMCHLQETYLISHTNWKWEDGRKYSMQTEIKAGVAIFMSHKIDLKECYKRQGHCIMIKGSTREDITIINTYAPNIGSNTIYKATTNSFKRRDWQ